jgi:hypothetical protein
MPRKPVLEIDKKYFVVKLYDDLLEVDLKEGAKKELEDVVEAHPILRESLGILFQTIVPLDVALHEVETAKVDDKGRLKIVIPLRRDITIPLEADESRRVADKLNGLIPEAKLKEAERLAAIEEAEKTARYKPRETV